MSYYAVPDSYWARYPARRQSSTSAEVQAILQEASGRLDMQLAKGFAVPFSSNNFTATWLTILLAEYILRSRMEDPKKMEGLKNELIDVFCGLMTMAQPMLDNSGNAIWANISLQPSEAGHVTAVDGGFLPYFTMDDPKYQVLDSDRITDERGRRGITSTNGVFPWTGEDG